MSSIGFKRDLKRWERVMSDCTSKQHLDFSCSLSFFYFFISFLHSVKYMASSI